MAEETKKAPTVQKTASSNKDYFELRIPRIKKTKTVNLLGILLLMALSFIAGHYYTTVYDMLFNPKLNTVQDALMKYARQTGLNRKEFNNCLSQNKYASQVTAEENEGTQLGVGATPSFFVNGKFIGGAFPVEAFKDVIDKELAGTATENAADYIDVLKQANEDPNQKGFDPVPKNVAVGSAPVEGAANAKVTIVEFSDFQCPFCERAFSTMKQIMSDYKSTVRLVYKQYPLTSIHPNAQIAAEASLCAKEQNKFWEFHDKLFTNQQEWSPLPQQGAK